MMQKYTSILSYITNERTMRKPTPEEQTAFEKALLDCARLSFASWYKDETVEIKLKKKTGFLWQVVVSHEEEINTTEDRLWLALFREDSKYSDWNLNQSPAEKFFGLFERFIGKYSETKKLSLEDLKDIAKERVFNKLCIEYNDPTAAIKRLVESTQKEFLLRYPDAGFLDAKGRLLGLKDQIVITRQIKGFFGDKTVEEIIDCKKMYEGMIRESVGKLVDAYDHYFENGRSANARVVKCQRLPLEESLKKHFATLQIVSVRREGTINEEDDSQQPAPGGRAGRKR